MKWLRHSVKVLLWLFSPLLVTIGYNVVAYVNDWAAHQLELLVDKLSGETPKDP